VPDSLQRSSRKLAIALHHTAAKAGAVDEWARFLGNVITTFHQTADQVLRGVRESWEPSTDYRASKVDFDEQPHGGGDGPGEFPPWHGITAGSNRMIGLLNLMSDALRYQTKGAVTIPAARLMDVIARGAQVARLSPKTQTWEQAVETEPAVGREEKDELWSVMPDIHIASLDLLAIICDRLGQSFQHLVSDAIDDLTRMFKSGMSIAGLRSAAYRSVNRILLLCGPTMPKATVVLLEPLIAGCCRDLQQSHGFIREPDLSSSSKSSGKKNATLANADLFLLQQTESKPAPSVLDADHLTAAEDLLALLLTSLPQKHLRSALRGLLDRTAIVTRNKHAMVASVLNPYRDQRQKMHPSILPFLAQQFPHDQTLEVLRSNMHRSSHSSDTLVDIENDIEETPQESEEAEPGVAGIHGNLLGEEMEVIPSSGQDTVPTIASGAKRENGYNPFEEIPSDAVSDDNDKLGGFASRPAAKRKHEGDTETRSKRRDVAPDPPVHVQTREPESPGRNDGEDSGDESSVHLDMELDTDDGDEDEDEDEEADDVPM
jgi:hypothetical protein